MTLPLSRRRLLITTGMTGLGLIATEDAHSSAVEPRAEHHVDAAAGEPTITSLQELIDATESGETLNLPDHSTYREKVTIPRPMTIVGGTDVRIMGSDIWTDWSSGVDSLWRSVMQVPDFGPANLACEAGEGDRCRMKEQVYIDGKYLYQLPAGSSPISGQFSLDEQRRVVLHDDPNGHTVEVTTRDFWLKGSCDNVTIDNITFRHAANDRGLAGVEFGGDNWTLKNCSLAYAHAANVSIGRVSGSLLLDNEYFAAGQVGISGTEANGKIIGGHVYGNNIVGTASGLAGGIKIAKAVDITISGVEVDHNVYNGIWVDVPNEGQKVTINNNRVHHNLGNGIRAEVTTGADISHNVVYENGWARQQPGIMMNASSDVNVHQNVLAWNYGGIMVRNPLRTDKHPEEDYYDFVRDVYVHDNTVMALDVDSPEPRYALSWIKAWDGGNIYNPAASNGGSHDKYYYAGPESDADRFFWISGYAHLSDFNMTPGEDAGAYLPRAEAESILKDNGLPLVPEKHELR